MITKRISPKSHHAHHVLLIPKATILEYNFIFQWKCLKDYPKQQRCDFLLLQEYVVCGSNWRFMNYRSPFEVRYVGGGGLQMPQRIPTESQNTFCCQAKGFLVIINVTELRVCIGSIPLLPATKCWWPLVSNGEQNKGENFPTSTFFHAICSQATHKIN